MFPDVNGNRGIILATTTAVVLITLFLQGGATEPVIKQLGIKINVKAADYLRDLDEMIDGGGYRERRQEIDDDEQDGIELGTKTLSSTNNISAAAAAVANAPKVPVQSPTIGEFEKIYIYPHLVRGWDNKGVFSQQRAGMDDSSGGGSYFVESVGGTPLPKVSPSKHQHHHQQQQQQQQQQQNLQYHKKLSWSLWPAQSLEKKSLLPEEEAKGGGDGGGVASSTQQDLSSWWRLQQQQPEQEDQGNDGAREIVEGQKDSPSSNERGPAAGGGSKIRDEGTPIRLPADDSHDNCDEDNSGDDDDDDDKGLTIKNLTRHRELFASSYNAKGGGGSQDGQRDINPNLAADDDDVRKVVEDDLLEQNLWSFGRG